MISSVLIVQGPPKVYGALREDILDFIKQAQERVLSHQEEQALLKAYIAEWRKFFTQCSYLPMPFGQLETALQVSWPQILSMLLKVFVTGQNYCQCIKEGSG